MAGNQPFLFMAKKNFCLLICIVQIVIFVLLAIFSGKIKDSKVENSNAYPDEVDAIRVSFIHFRPFLFL